MIVHGIDLGSEAVRRFCRRWGIRRLAVFGSVLRSDFRTNSDVDLLFALDDESSLTLFRWQDMEDDLAAILGRRVDLVHERSLAASDNRYRRQEILQTARVVYDTGRVVAA